MPLDHSRADGPRITIFTREVAAPDGGDRPYLLFLQGGPGFEATRPTSPPTGWMKRALADYRVLLLDQRGTGRSTPVGREIPGDDARRSGRVPDPFPRGFDRARRRARPSGARCRPLERARPELRWLHLDDVPVDRAGGPPRGLHHGRPVADRPAGGRHLRRHLPAADRGQPALLRALSGRSSASRRDPPAPGGRGRAPPVRRPTHGAPLPPARDVARRQRRPSSSCTT